MSQDFALTIPFEKSERQDGWYITGVAAGIDVDSQGERLSPDAIQRFVQHINTNGPIPFKDWHQKNTVTSDIGEVVKAWINPDFQMGVEVKLDEDHPTASLVWKKIQKGKQYGMSVHGKVLEYRDEYEKAIGRQVRTFYNVILDEISLTTRPVWTPSLGTVLSKAVDESLEGDTTSMAEETPNAEETTVETTDSNSNENDGVEKSETTTDPNEQSSEPENESSEGEVVEKAVSPKSASALQLKKILQANREMNELLAEFLGDGSNVDESTDSTTSETVTETTKAEGSETQSDEYTKALDEITDLRNQIVELRALIPSTIVPPVLQKAENDSFMEEVSKMNPRDRMRVALAALHDER